MRSEFAALISKFHTVNLEIKIPGIRSGKDVLLINLGEAVASFLGIRSSKRRQHLTRFRSMPIL